MNNFIASYYPTNSSKLASIAAAVIMVVVAIGFIYLPTQARGEQSFVWLLPIVQIFFVVFSIAVSYDALLKCSNKYALHITADALVYQVSYQYLAIAWKDIKWFGAKEIRGRRGRRIYKLGLYTNLPIDWQQLNLLDMVIGKMLLGYEDNRLPLSNFVSFDSNAAQYLSFSEFAYTTELGKTLAEYAPQLAESPKY